MRPAAYAAKPLDALRRGRMAAPASEGRKCANISAGRYQNCPRSPKPIQESRRPGVQGAVTRNGT